MAGGCSGVVLLWNSLCELEGGGRCRRRGVCMWVVPEKNVCCMAHACAAQLLLQGSQPLAECRPSLLHCNAPAACVAPGARAPACSQKRRQCDGLAVANDAESSRAAAVQAGAVATGPGRLRQHPAVHTYTDARVCALRSGCVWYPCSGCVGLGCNQLRLGVCVCVCTPLGVCLIGRVGAHSGQDVVVRSVDDGVAAAACAAAAVRTARGGSAHVG